MGRKKKYSKKQKHHFFIYDESLAKDIELIKEREGLTTDKLFRAYLRLPDSDELINMRYMEAAEQLAEKYKREDLILLMSLLWNFIINAAQGEYDIKKLIYDIEADIRLKTYRKR